jgi:hypothetical protein
VADAINSDTGVSIRILPPRMPYRYKYREEIPDGKYGTNPDCDVAIYEFRHVIKDLYRHVRKPAILHLNQRHDAHLDQSNTLLEKY